ncbi:MAG: hypothetical protein L0211_14095, partial [Planctomycetaceae bacterium]|nr:hypothetical protein [Planctomycetaceae bacterium]
FLDVIGVPVPIERREEVAFYAAQRLRNDYPERNEAWVRRVWQDGEIARIIEIIRDEIRQTLSHRPVAIPLFRFGTGTKAAQSNGFTPWVLFRNRATVPRTSGIYLIAQFDSSIPEIVDPLAFEVIDIGMAGSQKIDQRLHGFEQVALTGWGGKSSGWTYHTEFVKDYDQLVNFTGLYASWIELPDWDVREIASHENWFLVEFMGKWDRRPRINKQPLKAVAADFRPRI